MTQSEHNFSALNADLSPQYYYSDRATDYKQKSGACAISQKPHFHHVLSKKYANDEKQ